MGPESESSPERHDLSTHILSASVVMLGVSTTLIGLVKVAKNQMGSTRVDEYAGFAALLFLFSACGSYLSIRYKNRTNLSQICENLADQIFICGLAAISAIAVLYAYELI